MITFRGINPHRYRYKWSADLLYRNENTDRYASHWHEKIIMRSQREPENHTESFTKLWSLSGGISRPLFSAGTESRKFTFHFQVSLQLFYCVQSSLRVTALSLKEILSTLFKTPSFSVCRPTQEKPLQLFYKGHSSRAKRRSSGNHK